MANVYGFLVPEGTDSTAAMAAFDEARRRREAAGRMALSADQLAALTAAIAEINGEFVPQFDGDQPAALESVWRLPDDDMFTAPGQYRDMPRTWPRCLARAELNGWWEDLMLTEDGRWLHRDDPRFGSWVLPLEYELESTEDPTVRYTGTLEALAPEEEPARTACVRHGIEGIGFGTDSATGWVTLVQPPRTADSPQLPWRFRVTAAGGRPWKRATK